MVSGTGVQWIMAGKSRGVEWKGLGKEKRAFHSMFMFASSVVPLSSRSFFLFGFFFFRDWGIYHFLFADLARVCFVLLRLFARAVG